MTGCHYSDSGVAADRIPEPEPRGNPYIIAESRAIRPAQRENPFVQSDNPWEETSADTDRTIKNAARQQANTRRQEADQVVTARWVPEKPGHVYSPFGDGIIDVTGFPPGSMARDPFTKKVFLVPMW